MSGTVTKEDHNHQYMLPPKDVKNINCWQRADTFLFLTLNKSRDLIHNSLRRGQALDKYLLNE